MARHNDLGEKGEELAVEYLINHGYNIVKRNYRYLKAEIDIIAQKETVLVGVEVKTRTSDFFGNPQDFISKKKIKLLVTALDHFIVDSDLEVEARLDVIAIIQQKNTFKIEHLKDAFLYF